MKKYRKKPIVIEAEQWLKLGDVSEAPIIAYVPGERYKRMVPIVKECAGCGIGMPRHGNCKTLEGFHIVCPGDWIIKGIKGEYYPCKPDIFGATYEAVEETI